MIICSIRCMVEAENLRAGVESVMIARKSHVCIAELGKNSVTIL
jgi:hypothetical protein